MERKRVELGQAPEHDKKDEDEEPRIPK